MCLLFYNMLQSVVRVAQQLRESRMKGGNIEAEVKTHFDMLVHHSYLVKGGSKPFELSNKESVAQASAGVCVCVCVCVCCVHTVCLLDMYTVYCLCACLLVLANHHCSQTRKKKKKEGIRR